MVLDDLINDNFARMKRTRDKYKAHLSFQLNLIDYVNPSHHMGLKFFFALHQAIWFEQAS